MSEIKPKKERRFLKTLVRVGEILVEQVLLKLGSSIIKKIGGKKTLPSILFTLASLSLFAQYPATGNKQRLGFQTTGDGLVYRGRAADTVGIKSSGLNNAYFILDTVNNIQYNYIKTKGGWVFSNGDTIIINNNFTQPVDSLFFNVGVPTDNVDTAKMRWDSNLATVVLGLNDNVPNELGFKNFWLVKNQTGATITKGSLVYANGTLGASGRITVAKFIANGSIDAKYLLGITAHDLSNGEDGYVISFGKIRQVNTDTFAAGAILYPSPTVAGVWTDIEPVAPNLDMPIGFCINSHVNNGTIAIRVASGYSLNELHDVRITSPVDRASLYYRGGLWRDTTAALLTSDTASMLTPYLRTGVAASTYLPLTGGILTGALTGTTGTFTGLNINNTTTEGVFTLQGYDNNTATRIQFKTDNIVRQEMIKPTSASNLQFRSYPTGTASGGYEFYVSNGSTESLAATMGTDKSLSLTGTLGVTGATTLSAPLTVNSSAVFNEGSAIADFRVESDNNANMLFVDGTNNRVGIGTNAPTRTLEVSGTLNATGDITEGGLNVLTSSDTASLSTRIDARLNKSDTATMLNPYWRSGKFSGTLPIANGGTGAESASVARVTLGVAYIFTEVTAGSSVTLSSNRASIVNTGGASTTQLDLTPATNGRMYMIKNLATGTVVSLHSNVIPLTGGSPTTAILSAGNVTPQWVTLVADGTNWHVMQRN